MKLKEQLGTLEGTKLFFKGLSEQAKKNLLTVMNEELDMIKKYKIIADINLCCDYEEAQKVGQNSLTILTITSDFNEFTIEGIDTLCKEGILEKDKLNADIMEKIKYQRLSLDEANYVVKILNDANKNRPKQRSSTLRSNYGQSTLVEGTITYNYRLEISPNQN